MERKAFGECHPKSNAMLPLLVRQNKRTRQRISWPSLSEEEKKRYGLSSACKLTSFPALVASTGLGTKRANV
jgi:hypothetical protein